MLIAGNCYSATGNASDGIAATLAVLGFLMFLLAIVTLTGFVKRQIKAIKAKRALHQADIANHEDLLLSTTS